MGSYVPITSSGFEFRAVLEKGEGSQRLGSFSG